MDTIALALQKVAASANNAALNSYFQEFKGLYDQRLWHQLTVKVQEFYARPDSKPVLGALYQEFILLWWKKMNPLVFVKLAVATARTLDSANSIALLEDVGKKLDEVKDATKPSLVAFAALEAASYRLQSGDVTTTKETIDQCAPLVEMFASVDPMITATYFRTCLTYDKATLAFSAYYKDTLMYLSCLKDSNHATLNGEAQEMAHDLCIAALLGDSIYNFGELLNHPILDALKGSGVAFLRDVLFAFNAGDHDAIQKLLPMINKHPALASKIDFLNQKLCLMALVECVFRQLKVSRQLPLPMVANAARVPLDQVEHLLMRALSLKLIRGSMHEVEGYFQIEWVQPRTLDANQIIQLKEGIKGWRERVAQTAASITALLPPTLATLASD